MRPPRSVRCRWLALAVLLAAAPHPAGAQQLHGYEAGVQGLVLAQDPLWAGGALYGGWRPGGGARLSLSLGVGSAAGEVGGRGELLGHFLLSPARGTGLGPYVYGGAAAVTGSRHQGYLVAGLGLESRPAGPSGWFVEAGVGGGARFAAGWRLRRLARPGREGS